MAKGVLPVTRKLPGMVGLVRSLPAAKAVAEPSSATASNANRFGLTTRLQRERGRSPSVSTLIMLELLSCATRARLALAAVRLRWRESPAATHLGRNCCLLDTHAF